MDSSDPGFSKWCCLLVWILVICAPPAIAQGSSEEPYIFLRKYVGCSQSDLSALSRGEPLAKILQTDNPNEVAVFGAIRVNVPAEFFVQKYRDIVNFKKGKEVLQIGKFAQPPELGDLQSLTLDAAETSSLKSCIAGVCSMKLTSQMIDRLHKQVDWSVSTSNQQVTEVFRSMLLDYVANYWAKGNENLAVYEDKKTPVRLGDQLWSLLQASPYLKAYVPEFEKYLANYPNSRLPGGEDFIYWSKEQFGVKPVVSVSHVTIDRIADNNNPSIVIGSKQIFANHYFTTSLGLAAFTRVPGSGNEVGGYLMYLNRSRVDLLGGFFSFLKRWVLNRRLRQGLEDNLRLVKKRLETGYAP
jgi:hypothetical protein